VSEDFDSLLPVDEVHRHTPEQLAEFAETTFPAMTTQVPGPLVVPEDAAPPLTDEEYQAMQESVVTGGEVAEDLDQEVDVDALASAHLRLLGPDEVPVVGTHYVVWGEPAMPMVVVRGAYAVSENDHVRLTAVGTDPVRQGRAEAYARWRYKGFVSGQVSGL
jgi:hypothetical protein